MFPIKALIFSVVYNGRMTLFGRFDTAKCPNGTGEANSPGDKAALLYERRPSGPTRIHTATLGGSGTASERILGIFE